MTGTDELDVEVLERDLEQIKDAMGIHERYPSAFHAWLVYGLLVPLAALGSQAVVLYDLPGWGHWLSWGGFLGAGGVYLWLRSAESSGPESGAGKPSIGLQWWTVFGYALVVLLVVSPEFSGVDPITAQASVFAVLVGAVGASYLLLANALEAYYVRQFDRRVIAAGGLWMLALAVAIAWVEPLQAWGYLVFGLAYFVYAMAAYLSLRRRTESVPSGEPA